MDLICLCPTYGRPSLVANSLALFLLQELRPSDTAHLEIFDDAGQIAEQSGASGPLTWHVMSQSEWIPLQRKYAPMLARHARHLGSSDAAFVVWDDDDVYLPWHLAAHATALQSRPWSHPSRAYSTCGINPQTQPPAERRLNGGHYHGALAIRGDLMNALGDWPDTDRSDFDQQQLARCRHHAGPPGDPCAAHPPSYIYRWADTGRDHCSARIRDKRYQMPRVQEPEAVEWLCPAFDKSAMAILDRLFR